MTMSSAINTGLPAVPLADDPVLNSELTVVYNAIRIIQQTLDENGITPASGSTTVVADVAHGGTGVDTITGIVKGNGTAPFTAITNSAGLAAAISDETGSGALVFASGPTIAAPTITAGSIQASTLVTPKLTGYTVATLPVGAVGMLAYVTDALAPAFLAPVVGGGAVVCPVFYNGAAWIVG
jgi:hypothetical protein